MKKVKITKEQRMRIADRIREALRYEDDIETVNECLDAFVGHRISFRKRDFGLDYPVNDITWYNDTPGYRVVFESVMMSPECFGFDFPFEEIELNMEDTVELLEQGEVSKNLTDNGGVTVAERIFIEEWLEPARSGWVHIVEED